MEGHAKKCVERYCFLAAVVQSLYSMLGRPSLQETVGEVSKVCSQVVLKSFICDELVEQTFYGP